MWKWMLLGWLGLWPVHGSGAGVPWSSGDILTYEVHWGMVVAAEAKSSVVKTPEGWEAVLELRTRGMAEALYPIRSRFVSRFDAAAVHSFGLESVRREGGEDKHQRLVLDPALRRGRFENVLEKTTKEIELPEEACQDVLSLMFAARTVTWGPGISKEWDVCEKQRVKRMRLKWVREETLRGRSGEDVPCFVLEARELADRKGKSPKKPLQVTIWVERKNSQPLAADLRAAFGTFRMTRVPGEL